MVAASIFVCQIHSLLPMRFFLNFGFGPSFFLVKLSSHSPSPAPSSHTHANTVFASFPSAYDFRETPVQTLLSRQLRPVIFHDLLVSGVPSCNVLLRHGNIRIPVCRYLLHNPVASRELDGVVSSYLSLSSSLLPSLPPQGKVYINGCP